MENQAEYLKNSWHSENKKHDNGVSGEDMVEAAAQLAAGDAWHLDSENLIVNGEVKMSRSALAEYAQKLGKKFAKARAEKQKAQDKANADEAKVAEILKADGWLSREHFTMAIGTPKFIATQAKILGVYEK